MLTPILNFFRKNKELCLVIVVALIFFLGTSFFYSALQSSSYQKWSSPDETANYFFTKQYALHSVLSAFEPNNIIASDLVHPRSFRSDFGVLKPVSFLGIMLIYGTIAKLFSIGVIPFLTPFFGALGIILFYLLIKELWNKRLALGSALFLAAFPVYQYFSAKSMFHNILFIVLLIGSLFFLVKTGKEKRVKEKILALKVDWRSLLFSALGGALLGLTVITRTSELLWLLPMMFLIWLFNIKRFGLIRLLISLAFFLFALLPLFYQNQILYDSPWRSGYVEMNKALEKIFKVGRNFWPESKPNNEVMVQLNNTQSNNIQSNNIQSSNIPNQNNLSSLTLIYNSFKQHFLASSETVKNTIFYFGLHPKQSFLAFDHYVKRMFPYLFWPAIIGLLFFVILALALKESKRRHLVFIISWLLISFILILYYGSWKFNDNPDPNSFTIGNSYTRYWLPVYLGLIPFAVWLLMGWLDLILSKFIYLKNFIFLSLVMIIMTIGSYFTVFGSEEGLYYLLERSKYDQQIFQEILAQTENNSVIITFYHDKLLFPERKVIFGLLNDNNMNAIYARLAKRVPVYYFNFTLGEKDLKYLNDRKLKEAGLHIKIEQEIGETFSLYRLELLPGECRR
ncbi:MAG: hypothetical protein MUF50_01395 [Planctomycetes bacterium]|jgi:hypothetical protein|nr:hypothetical protein [Planctomycetota bacterium]